MLFLMPNKQCQSTEDTFLLSTANSHQICPLGQRDEDTSHGPVEGQDSLSD